MPGPLDGIRVLDFTWALAGPYGTMILADLGAEVWKIETIGQTERRRGAGPYVHDVSTYFFSVNRGKKSLMLDLKAPEATDIVQALVRKVDVLTENFSPGTMEKLGFGYEALSAVNPRLIYASTSGFGHTGPYRERGAVDAIVQGREILFSLSRRINEGLENTPLAPHWQPEESVARSVGRLPPMVLIAAGLAAIALLYGLCELLMYWDAVQLGSKLKDA